MQPDPPYLSHFGEFATLKNTLASYFSQDWSLDSDSEEGVWRLIVRENPPDELARLVEQIGALLTRSDEEVQTVFHVAADGLSYPSASDTRQFLEVFSSFVQTYGLPD